MRSLLLALLIVSGCATAPCHSREAHAWAEKHGTTLECDGFAEDTEAEDEDLTDAQISAKYGEEATK